MPRAETGLARIRQRGARGWPRARRPRHRFTPPCALLADGRLAATPGALTPGGTGETVDGLSREKSGARIDARRRDRSRWSPVTRVDLPQTRGTRRPLGLPTGSDTRGAEVVRRRLEASDDVQCSAHAQGCRPGRGGHTALAEVVRVWKGPHGVLEGDLSDGVGRRDHEVLRSMLRSSAMMAGACG